MIRVCGLDDFNGCPSLLFKMLPQIEFTHRTGTIRIILIQPTNNTIVMKGMSAW
jgi:hypothetical protein